MVCSFYVRGRRDSDIIFMPVKKQKKELAGWIAGTKARLGNEKFLAKAPANVVAEAKAQLASMEEKLARTDELLESLK